MTSDIIEWLQFWYNRQVDGEWEHQFGIQIETLDNPGWSVSIDVKDTSLRNCVLIEINHLKSDTDWIRIWKEDGKFQGVGDPFKLGVILDEFHKWASQSAPESM